MDLEPEGGKVFIRPSTETRGLPNTLSQKEIITSFHYGVQIQQCKNLRLETHQEEGSPKTLSQKEIIFQLRLDYGPQNAGKSSGVVCVDPFS